MRHYNVTATIQSPNIDANFPVAVQWYDGTDHAAALAALVSAGAQEPDDRVPESVRYAVLGVSMTITEVEGPRSDETVYIEARGYGDDFATWQACKAQAAQCDGLPLSQTTCPDRAGHM